eukprot:scaffold186608_cov32-Tisochrysis_lutea.AAC.2
MTRAGTATGFIAMLMAPAAACGYGDNINMSMMHNLGLHVIPRNKRGVPLPPTGPPRGRKFASR